MTVYAEGPGESPGFLLWRVTLRWQRLVTEALRPLDLTHVQFVLLASAWWLSRDGGSPNQLALATHAGTNVKMTSEVLRKLEDKGLIVARTDPTDRRARLIVITPEGVRLAEQAVSAVEAVDVAFFSAAPPAVVPALQSLANYEPRPEGDSKRELPATCTKSRRPPPGVPRRLRGQRPPGPRVRSGPAGLGARTAPAAGSWGP